MPNQITAAGLETQTQAEYVTQFTTAFQAIYGTDINLSSNTPDGQMMNTFIQAVLDELDVLTQVYNGMDPDKAIGVVLDARCAYNGIQRQAGTYSITNITLTTTDLLSEDLVGLDTDPEAPYTVSDAEGNRWLLQLTQSGLSPGNHVLSFRAEFPGEKLTTINTITVPVTVVLGVEAINNPTAQSVIGINTETDAALRIRRAQSVALGSQGYPAAMRAALANVAGVTYVQVYENRTGATDADGVPGHSMWAVLGGAGLPADIAQAIFAKRNMGCGLKGAQTYEIDPGNSNPPFVAQWDDVTPENLYIEFSAISIDGINLPNVAAILSASSGLETTYVPQVAETVDENGLSTAVQAIDPNTLVVDGGFSSAVGGPYTNTLAPASKARQFVVANQRILIIYGLTDEIPSLGTLQLYAAGGTPAYTWSVVSGTGSVDSAGLFTPSGAGVSVIRVTDNAGLKADITVTVV